MASRTPPSEALAGWLAGQRWFASKSRRIAAVAIEDRVPLAGSFLAIVRVDLEHAASERYAVPLRPGPVPADALDDPEFCTALLRLMGGDDRARGDAGDVVGHATRTFPALSPGDLAVRRVGGEQSNTSIAFGDALMLKHFRQLSSGLSPELEITRFLTERTTYGHTPRLAGWLDYQPRAGEACTLAVAQELVIGAEDGWQWMLAQLGRTAADLAAGSPTVEEVRRAARPTLEALRRLGRRTAELHLALASDASDPAFAPERITDADLARWEAGITREIEDARQVLKGRALPGAPAARPGLRALAGRMKTRHHGDYHLGQTLRVDARDDFAIIDFEGEPVRPLAERRAKHTPLRDVAGMLRSINYAAASVGDHATERGWTATWETEARRLFVEGYRTAAGTPEFLPATEDGFRRAVAVFELEKAAYEIVYEANHRPDWIEIPVRGFARASAALGS
jgi:trehalose synthase-fused probable maltokinase